ncbi:MAG: helix-turn-helix transcriptional regulator [Lachnospiraceae bacterium]|nr:helix-turn-helix transcriptional regulator [Lachnospiraceae bacterium]MBQ3968249.1 helix-turn-helix transcriptional regulator [Lachnospiraceae bacterium]
MDTKEKKINKRSYNSNITNESLIRISKMLESRGWSLYHLAKVSDIPPTSLNNLFQRNNEPTVPTLRKICSGFGITLSDFFGNEIPEEPPKYTAEDLMILSMLSELDPDSKKRLISYIDGLRKLEGPSDGEK